MSEVKYQYRIELVVAGSLSRNAVMTQYLVYQTKEAADAAHATLKKAMVDVHKRTNDRDAVIELTDAVGVLAIPADEIISSRVCSCEAWAEYADEMAARAKRTSDILGDGAGSDGQREGAP